MNWKLIFVAALIAYGGYQHFNPESVHGDKTPAQIKQAVEASTIDGHFQLNGYTISPIAPFEITARVLSTKHYRSDREAELSPVDLALGWGRMAEDSVLNDVTIVQKGRFYFWRVVSFPIPRQEIETSSANMHMVPANGDIEKTLKSIKQGQSISIQGSLINVAAEDGWRWKSSTTRNDTGKGACELVYVEKVLIH